MKTRIVDIARLANVSPGTVDRVIHNRGEVSETTRKKVEDIIQELDYQPDILARSLATKRQLNFFLLIPVSANENEFWHAPLKGVDKALGEIQHYGIRITKRFYNHFDVGSFVEESQKLLLENPDGVLFAPVFANESQVFMKQLRRKNIPVLLFNSNLDGPVEADFIGQDSVQSGYLAAKLLTYGFSGGGHILVVNISARKDNYNHILRRERGFRKYFAENHLDEFSITTLESLQSTSEILHSKLDREMDMHDVRAIFVTNSRVYQVARYLELKGQAGMRLIGYDLLPENVRWLKEGFIDFLISQRPEEQGYMAVISMFNRLFLGRDVESEQYLPIDIITKENIDYYKFR